MQVAGLLCNDSIYIVDSIEYVDLGCESTLEFRSTFLLYMFHFSSCSLAYSKGNGVNI